MKKYILALETSCDETAIALIDLQGNIVADAIFSQIEIHQQYGGVVPEVASRNHSTQIQKITTDLFAKYNIKPSELLAIAATCGPGLLGAIIVGMMFAKGMAHYLSIPFIPINHLEGHVLSTMIEDRKLNFPFLVMLISGGHCIITIAHSLGKYETLGQTLDDAAGEAFDKTARMLGFPYPGGKEIDRLASQGDQKRFPLPLTMTDKKTIDMSFSGLKTAALRQIRSQQLDQQKIADFAASIQWSITKILQNSLTLAIELYCKNYPNYQRRLVVCGGVAANSQIRNMLATLTQHNDFTLSIPSFKYCTDNASMIAMAALQYYKKPYANFSNTLSFAPQANWPLEKLYPNQSN